MTREGLLYTLSMCEINKNSSLARTDVMLQHLIGAQRRRVRGLSESNMESISVTH